jgi:GntR family transcriptional regulator
MKVDDNDPRPPYVQVADALRTAIRDGQLAPGQRLPPGRELATQFGVALMTARKAIDALRTDGLVISQQGRGVFVTAVKPEMPADDLTALKATVEDLARRLSDLETRLGSKDDQ